MLQVAAPAGGLVEVITTNHLLRPTLDDAQRKQATAYTQHSNSSKGTALVPGGCNATCVRCSRCWKTKHMPNISCSTDDVNFEYERLPHDLKPLPPRPFGQQSYVQYLLCVTHAPCLPPHMLHWLVSLVTLSASGNRSRISPKRRRLKSPAGTHRHTQSQGGTVKLVQTHKGKRSPRPGDHQDNQVGGGQATLLNKHSSLLVDSLCPCGHSQHKPDFSGLADLQPPPLPTQQAPPHTSLQL